SSAATSGYAELVEVADDGRRRDALVVGARVQPLADLADRQRSRRVVGSAADPVQVRGAAELGARVAQTRTAIRLVVGELGGGGGERLGLGDGVGVGGVGRGGADCLLEGGRDRPGGVVVAGGPVGGLQGVKVLLLERRLEQPVGVPPGQERALPDEL